MKIEVKESTVVTPAPARPSSRVWISNVDDVFLENYHTRTHSFYRPNATADDDFFNTAVLMAALARTLSEFYPIAGRLCKDENGRVEIDCNGEGAIFMEAAADGEIDDLGDFAPRSDISLAPHVDYSRGISSFPLLLVQVTRFKCGGVCLGVTIGHKTQDGISSLHLLTRWGDIARGIDVADVKPYFDRRVLAARNPPQPKFDHVEFHPPPSLKNASDNSNISETKFSVFKLSRQQLNILKENCKEDGGKLPLYSSFEALTGHAWKCICKARGLEENQETRLIVMVDGRSRLRPPLLPGYFGNVTFKAALIASSSEIRSNPLKFTVQKVREALARMDDEYLRSAIDYLEVQGGLGTDVRGSKIHKSPNMGVTSWAKLPLYDVNFGWGGPFYVGLGFVPVEGHVILMPAPINDGGLSLVIALPAEEMKLFETSFYEMVSSV